MNKRIFTFFLSLVFLFACAGCATTPKHVPPDPSPNEVLYGFAEPMTNSQVKEFNLEKSADLMQSMNAKSFRSFIDIDVVDGIKDADATVEDVRINERRKAVFDNIHTLLQDHGIGQIVGAVGFYPLVPSTRNAVDINTVPNPFGEKPDRDYVLFLEKIEKAWFEMAKAFPDIKYWEVGNEPNMNGFLHPITYIANAGQDLDASMSSNPTAFTMEQKAFVLTDILYYANRGMKRGNTNSVLIMPGLAPVGFLSNKAIPIFLEEIYKNIESNEFPSTLNEKSNVSSDFFQGLAWHPYYHMDRAPDQSWSELNDEIYDIAIKHGDDGIRVWFTEFGMTDTGSPEAANDENQAVWYREYFAQMEKMQYLEACHIFRLYECSVAAGWGGVVEWHYGIFKEPADGMGFVPKQKALSLYELMGGTGDLYEFA